MSRILPSLLLAACAPSSPKEVGVGDEVAPVDPVDVVDTDLPEPLDDSGADTDAAAGPPEDTAPPPDTSPPVDTGWERAIEILLTADDAWELYLDGQPLTDAGADAWSLSTRLSTTVPGRRHVIAVHAVDLARVISGFQAAVWVSTELWSVTGDGRWRVSGAPPPADWTQLGFDDSAWSTPYACPPAETVVWGGRPTDVLATGAAWIWDSSCRDLGEAWFRLVIE